MPQATNKSQQGNKTAQSGQNGAEKKLTAAQLDRMYRKAQDAGLSKEQTDGRINYLYSKKPADMTRAEYDDICKRMDDTAKELRNGGNRQ